LQTAFVAFDVSRWAVVHGRQSLKRNGKEGPPAAVSCDVAEVFLRKVLKYGLSH
jgi:hypothetical protein